MNVIKVGDASGLVRHLRGEQVGELAEPVDPRHVPVWSVSTATPEERARDDLAAAVAANQAELDRLLTKPIRGGCPNCLDRLWCADSEEEALVLVAAHIATEHTVSPMVWRVPVDSGAPVLAAAPPGWKCPHCSYGRCPRPGTMGQCDYCGQSSAPPAPGGQAADELGRRREAKR